MRRQRHGLVTRGDEAASATRVDRLVHDAVVLQRRTDLRNKVDGHAELVKQLATRLGVDTPVTPVHRDGETEVDKTAEDARTSWMPSRSGTRLGVPSSRSVMSNATTIVSKKDLTL